MEKRKTEESSDISGKYHARPKGERAATAVTHELTSRLERLMAGARQVARARLYLRCDSHRPLAVNSILPVGGKLANWLHHNTISPKGSQMSAQDTNEPLSSFRDSHGGILKNLTRLSDLCQLVKRPGMEGAVEDSALAVWRFFREVLMVHHEEEEEELFSAVLRVKDLDPATRELVVGAVERLTREHREVEAEWAAIEPQVRKLSRGKLSILDVDRVGTLVRKYEAHARYEEDEFLPLSERVLSTHSEDLGKLGRALHSRHSSKWVAGYV